jgi:hypothetical protein
VQKDADTHTRCYDFPSSHRLLLSFASCIPFSCTPRSQLFRLVLHAIRLHLLCRNLAGISQQTLKDTAGYILLASNVTCVPLHTISTSHPLYVLLHLFTNFSSTCLHHGPHLVHAQLPAQQRIMAPLFPVFMTPSHMQGRYRRFKGVFGMNCIRHEQTLSTPVTAHNIHSVPEQLHLH